MPNTNYLIGRQPILNRNEEIVGFELLFRSSDSLGSAAVTSASHATATVIINTLTGFGLQPILGPHRGFINLDFDLLMSDVLEILPKERVVLELLETLQVTPELLKRCRELKEAGFSLALDDHEYATVFEKLYAIVEIVKVDLLQSPLERLGEMIERFRAFPVKLLAEKVETRAEYRQCLDLGFEFFQGYYFSKPALMEKKRFDETGANLLKLMRLINEDADLDKIEQTFRSSPGLTYKLLLLVNSVSLGVREKIHTVRHAVTLLGRRQIKCWIQLALFASDDSRGLENPMVDMAAVRAAFMEHLAHCHPLLRDNHDSADKAFMTGILSLLETIYDISMEDVVANLNLSEDIKDALVSRSGDFGRLLELTEMVERMEFKDAIARFAEIGISQDDVLAAQVKAYNWRGGM
jgi:EAL and modified HD-GYP domain-containing signal transduction protein